MNDYTDSSSENPDPGTVPAYLLAADNHNIGNTQGGSWFDPSTWGDRFSNAGSLISTGMLSGANSFYNTGVTIGNWFGAEAELNDTKDWISGLDSDLGAYYSKNRTAADLVGFIAGSLIPGIGGIKVFNAGQVALRAAAARGLIGQNLSKATGLLIPQTEKYIALAAGDITNATATFSSINANGIAALASGVGQNVLEGMAFETAVQATMFKSPILDGQDKWDIVKNIALGGAFQGVVGGAFQAASTLGSIKRIVTKAEGNLKAFSGRVIPEEGLSPAEKIIMFTEDKEAAMAPALGVTENYNAALKAHLDKIRRIDNDIRTQTHAMIKGEDPELGNMVADASYGGTKEDALNNLLHTEQLSRLNGSSAIETELNKAAKAGITAPELQTSFVKLTGEGAGTITDSEPMVTSLADKVRLRAGQNTEAAVLEAVKKEDFSLKKLWNPLGLNPASAANAADARYIWASKVLGELPPETNVHIHDIPLLERALNDGVFNINLVDKTGAVVQKGFTSKTALQDYIIDTKETVANEFIRTNIYKNQRITEENGMGAAAKLTNTKQARLEGTAGKPEDDYFAWQAGKADYQKFLESKGLSTPASEGADPRFLPTYAKLSKRVTDMEDMNGNIIDGMTWIKQQQSLLKSAVNNVFAKAAGDLAGNVPEITDAALATSNRYGAGAGLFKYANGGYGSLESTAQLLGSAVKQLKTKFRQISGDVLQGPLVNLGRSQEASIEFETISQKVSRSAQQWVRDVDGISGEENALITKDLQAASKKEGFEGVDGGSDQVIPITNKETAEAIEAHISRSGDRTTTYRELRAAQGLQDTKDPDVFRPIRPSADDHKFIAFVKDPMVTGQGHTSMIFASSERDLQALIDKVPPQYSTYTKRDVEEYTKARGEYDWNRGLHDSNIDSSLKNQGIFSNFFAKTDPQKIIDDIMRQHLREDDMLSVELMRAKNQNAFNYLEDQGNAYTKVAASKFGGYSDRLEAAGTNPYLDYIKTALDISKASEHPLLYGVNKFLDTAVSRAVDNISQVWNSTVHPTTDAKLLEINQLLDKYGMNTGYRDAATNLLANHTAPKGELTKFIRGANAILSKLILGLDPLNSLNNFLGANILRSTELKQVTDAINSGDSAIAGKLSDLLTVQLPGVGDKITTPSRLMANALGAFAKDDGTLLAKYNLWGTIKDSNQQFRDILDDFTLKGTETVSDLQSRIQRSFTKAKELTEIGEKATGNKFAERLNRFISSNVMDQLTSIGVDAGLITKQEQVAYVNTFVNRVEGNVISSQRPLMFQGPIGQAIGLFQSYQFNLMQQMFRYVAEGTSKDTAMLLGLQGTFYGLQGLPGFQFINQHVVGTLSGNPKHIDAYDSAYGILGKQLGDLALYGLPSNLLNANLYSRGDINPRQVTILPTSLPDVPFIGAFGKMLGSIKDATTKIANGGNVWESFLQGLEHQGMSRPLAGLAQTLQAAGPDGQVYSTSTKGSILGSNDLMSIATAVRLAGGRPMDEAIINDGVFRINSYQQMDTKKMQQLGEAVKSSSIQGNTPDGEQVGQFAQGYAAAGGKQINFNKFMMNQFKAANTSQADKITSQLQNPFVQKLQLLMGGGSDTTPLSSLSTPQ